MAARNSYVGAAVRVNSVRICNVKVVKNTDFINQYVVTARRVQSPERRVNYRYVLKGNMVAFFNVNYRWARVKITRYVVPVLTLNEGVAVGVNNPLSAYGTAVRFKRINENEARLTRYGVSNQRIYPSMFEVALSLAPFCRCKSTFALRRIESL